jgi:hypothetical protein
MKLFSPFRMREIELKNRIVVSPMCEYSAKDGHPQAWHLVHLGSRAIGGASLVFTEASAVEERGRISAADTGIYEDAHMASWRPIPDFIRSHGAVPGCRSRMPGERQAPRHRGLEASPCLSKMAAGNRLRRVRWRLTRGIPCRTNYPQARFGKLSRRSGSPRNVRSRLALKYSRFMPRTDICCTSFCRLYLMRGPTSMAVHL